MPELANPPWNAGVVGQFGTMGQGFPGGEPPRVRQFQGLLALELERQAGDDKGREKDRQKPLSSASEGDCFALGSIESLGSAGISAIANLHGVTSRFDWQLDRCVHFE